MKVFFVFITLIHFGFVNAQIENGMIAHFSFNNSYADLSSNSIVGTNNGTTFGIDRNSDPNNSIELNGTSSYFSFNSNDVKVDLPITISAWVKINSAGSPNMVFCSDNEYGDWNGYTMNIINSGNVILSISGGIGHQGSTNRRSFMMNNTLPLGTWNHVVGIIRDYDDMSIYVNCINEPGAYSGTGPTTMVYSSTESRVGGSQGGSTTPDLFFNGSIDQVVIWEREITPAEIVFMCDTDNTLSSTELTLEPKHIIKVIDLMGRKTEDRANTPLIYVYSDGSTEKVFRIE